MSCLRLIGVACLMSLFFALSGCKTKTIMPPIAMDAGTLRYPGKFVWFDLHAPDMILATQFYSAVLGWSFERTNPDSPKIKTILHKHVPVGNIIEEAETPRWQSFVSVQDAAKGFELAQAAGARAVTPPYAMPDRGMVATVADPGGAAVSMIASPVGDPRDMPPLNGAWMGAELWTSDMKTAITFYEVFAGYQARVISLQDGTPYVLLITKNRLRGGVMPTPLADTPSLWVPQVAVRDILAVVARVEAKGGQVLIHPQAGVEQGRTAVFADPFGAIIGVREIAPPVD